VQLASLHGGFALEFVLPVRTVLHFEPGASVAWFVDAAQWFGDDAL
jgi:hypothetical protein